jgi:hypothetical protein
MDVAQQTRIDRALAGFTPYAKDVIYGERWHVKDNSIRLFVMGGKTPEGKRLREEARTWYSAVWGEYFSNTNYSHLWVVRDGRRHLIHRRVSES